MIQRAAAFTVAEVAQATDGEVLGPTSALLAGVATDTRDALAGQLFARRNVEGMRAALEQVLVLDPGNERAGRLLALLVRRASEPSPR